MERLISKMNEISHLHHSGVELGCPPFPESEESIEQVLSVGSELLSLGGHLWRLMFELTGPLRHAAKGPE